MGFSYNKAISLKPTRELKLSTFLISLIVAAAMFVPFIIADKGYFIFYGDFNAQQIPFYQMCHAAVRNGEFGWNFLTDLGANFTGSYAFYLTGSPFFWFTIPFPNWFIPYLMGPLLILKFALSSLTAYLFIRRFTRTPEAARLGGILYAFSGFSIYNIFFNHFHEAIIIFPLLLLSFELLLTENRRGFFAFCVFLSACFNYFFFFGMVIFILIYYIIRVTSKAVKFSFGRLFIIALEAIIGFAMSAVILFPAIYSTISLDRVDSVISGWNAIMYGKEQIYLNIIQCFFFPPDLPARPIFFPGAEVRWSSLGGWLPLFSMVGVFAYCSANKGSWLKRIICTNFVFAMFPILNSAFSAFNYAYYARWFYMPILLLCLATVMVLEDREANQNIKTGSRWVAFITLAFAIIIGLFPTKNDDGSLTFGLFSNITDVTYIARFCITVAISLVSLVLLFLLIKCFKKRNVSFFNAALSIVCVISVIYGCIFIGTGKQHSYNEEEIFIPSVIEGNVELEGERGSFRIDTYACADNTGMFLEYPCINSFHSVVPQSITDFYKFVGQERVVASRPTTEGYALRNLLSVKYLLNLVNQDSFEDTNGTKMPGYKYIGTQSGYRVYENKNFIPYGFSYQNYISYKDCTKFSELMRPNIMLKAMVLDDEQIAKYGNMMTKLDTTEIHLENFEESLHDDCVLLSYTASDNFKQTKNGFTLSVEREKDNLVFISIPYCEGWSATVNGQKVDIEKVNVEFMAVPVSAGVSDIKFTYTSPYLALGIKVTLGAAIIWFVYTLICLLTRKKRKETFYPEGEALIEKWYAYDISDTLENDKTNGEKFTLDKIADQLSNEYPVKNNEFLGGFNVTVENPNDKD